MERVGTVETIDSLTFKVVSRSRCGASQGWGQGALFPPASWKTTLTLVFGYPAPSLVP